MTTHYHIGWNMPGYLPEMDPWQVEDAEDAKRSMIEELVRHADQDDMADMHDEAESLSALAEDLNLASVDQGWDGWSDRLHYWITPCVETECETEDAWV